MVSEGSTDEESPYPTWLSESAFPVDLSLFEVLSRFWTELKQLLPAQDIHVIDPYILSAGGKDQATYAGNVVSLLKPALLSAQNVIFVYLKNGDEGMPELLAKDAALLQSTASLAFIKGRGMHARYIVADRKRVLRMEFSLNRIGMSFGTVSLVENEDDRAAIIAELERLHPFGE